jgi:hypothetical protein
MGRVLDAGVDVAYKHEGYAAHVLGDGTLTSAYGREIDARKVGRLRAACECGWTGPRDWENDDEDPAGWPSDELEDAILADWEAHVCALLDVEQGRQRETLTRVLRGIGGRLADDVAAADGADVDAVLKRAVAELQHAAELAQRMTREDA